MATNKTSQSLIGTILLSCLFMACSPVHETRTGVAGGNSLGSLSSSASAFENSLYEELKVNCQSCHGTGDPTMAITDDVQQTHDLIEQLGFTNLESPADSQIVTLVNGGHQGLTPAVGTALENAIQSWANQLNIVAEEDTNNGIVSLSALRASTFTPKCAGCHSGANPPRGLDFSDINAIRNVIDTADVAQSTLIQRITSDDPAVRMPRNADPLDPQEIENITNWIAEGGQDN